MTSFDEIHTLVCDLNDEIERDDYGSFNSKVLGPLRPVKVSLSKKEGSVGLPAQRLGEGAALFEVIPGQKQFRFKATVKLEVEMNDGLTKTFEATSKNCLTYEQSLIVGAHMLLKTMSSAEDVFSEKMRRKCLRLHRLAYTRGLELSVNGKFPIRQENMYLEFKTSGDRSKPWPKKDFKEAFAELVPKTIAAFVNTSILHEKRPLETCMLVFGVVDTKGGPEHGLINGIAFTTDCAPSEPLLDFAQNLESSAQQQFRDSVYISEQNNGRFSSADKIAAAIHVHVHRLIPATSTDNKTTPILVSVGIIFDEDLYVARPCVLKDKETGRPLCYYRRPKPATHNLEKDLKTDVDEDTIVKFFETVFVEDDGKEFLLGTAVPN